MLGHKTYKVSNTTGGGASTVSSPYIGIDGIGGVEYDLRNLIDFPVAVSVDIKPGFDLLPTPFPVFSTGAVSVRYIFK